MIKPHVFALLCLAASLLAGCVQSPFAASTGVAPTVSPAPPKKTASSKPSAPTTAAPKVASKTAVASAPIKPIKQDNALQSGKKLSPQEVDDLIRRLSVCRPT